MGALIDGLDKVSELLDQAAQSSMPNSTARAFIPVAVAARPRTERNPQRKSALEGSPKPCDGRVALRSVPSKAVAGGTYTDTGPVGGDFSLAAIVSLRTNTAVASARLSQRSSSGGTAAVGTITPALHDCASRGTAWGVDRIGLVVCACIGIPERT